METAGLSQILIHTHEPTWRQIPEDCGLNWPPWARHIS